MIRELRGQLLVWYDESARQLPWRALPNETTPDPYHIWLSEVMLQQTTVAAVKDYYTKFLKLWPTIHDLSNAPNEDIMAAWAGLGYYARARNLHKCAQIVSRDLAGIFPETQAELKKLPGIGEYTSAAITAIAFNKPATVVDGNVERVMARLFNHRIAMPASKPELKAYAHEFFDGFEHRPGDLAQAFMDLGATICIPKAPRCSSCPLSAHCEAYKAGDPEKLPFKTPKKKRPSKQGRVYWIENEHGEILLQRRPEKGLLGGMLALPTSEWLDKNVKDFTLNVFFKDEKPYKKAYIEHVFTHFDLKLYLYKADVPENASISNEYSWYDPSGVQDTMPSVFAKAFNLFVAKY